MRSKRRIAVVTGTRAEFGLLTPIMHAINAQPELELQTIATGMHLSHEFGMTFQTIENEGFKIDAKVEMLLSSDTPIGISKSIGLGLIGMADTLDRLEPDLVLLLGDRFEILAAAIAATNARIPIAHIHGGETTEGMIDESIRHAITKMSLLHFTAAEPYRQRVIQMGEAPDRVFTVGAPGLDVAARFQPIERDELEETLDIQLATPVFAITFHPVTLERETSSKQFKALLDALDGYPQASMVITKPNADTDGRVIQDLIEAYSAGKPNVGVYTSLGQRRYLSLLAIADVVIGNSSSGIIEAPHFGLPTVNIGDRQLGRIAPLSVIHSDPTAQGIRAAIAKALDPSFRTSLRDMVNPYGSGKAAPQITEVLKSFNFHPEVLKKKFYEGGTSSK
ncbi:MAG: UDP-N-acetylglucosamine 2-epimerase (hydrolyzing) [Alphaproteobacteria bacterium]|nr:UDP-N-acetylglucosamine 2-epimerase (hydrolyzing) [Alphaproteobacteria bacterium]